MSVGQSTGHAHSILNVMRGTDYTAFTPYIQLHTGDPGSAGTANVSAETTRVSPTFGAPSAGAMAASAISWEDWDAGTEAISHISLWDASSSGNFKMSAELDDPKTVENGDTLNITPTVSQGPIAA